MPDLPNQSLDLRLQKLQSWKKESYDLRTSKDNRIAKNLKLMKGIWSDQTQTKSKITGKNKTFFRKIWSTVWRLTATMYQAYMKDPESFKISGRDLINDPRKAKVLQILTRYRKDVMMDTGNLFLKFIWAIINILTNGWTCGKLSWNPITDQSEFTLYPWEQVFPDMVAETDDKMRFITFLNYLTVDQMFDMGYPVTDVIPTAPETNQVRSVRFWNDIDPQVANRTPATYTGVGNAPTGGLYPRPGSAPDTQKVDHVKRYNVFESFWKDDGKIWYAVSLDFRHFLVEPMLSPYGDGSRPTDRFPIVTGQCLTEPHKLIGEGMPEPLEGPQESFNHNMGMRKDNVASSMAGHMFVSRYGGVDIGSLTRRRVNGVTMMDDITAVKHEIVPDVTQTAYIEARADESMMNEMSGDTEAFRGQQKPEIKATTAKLNFQQSNTKPELYVAIVGETFFKRFHMELARQIQMFETDENSLRIANEELRQKEGGGPYDDIYNLDFNANCTMEIGAALTGQGPMVQQTLLVLNTANQSLASIASLAQLGAIPKEGIKIPNIAAIFEDLMPLLGHRDIERYTITIPPPQAPAGGAPGVASQPRQGQISDTA
ncbi:hypothetical protein LCGC14_0514960 [marine sediment metagenome]|uniref:Portal protein n=1 Tax=marine sediment metagenome TaxID=412755 RepID=A0A0F9S043_9ZZZZ|nr:hypothetical protein [Candidatus Aminicenantes bacterium]